jgi:hypothetical protein
MSKPINWKETIPTLAIFTVLVLFTVFTVFPQTNLSYEQKSCILEGGHWDIFPDACAGTCGCGPLTQPMTAESCDCGLGKCWDKVKLKCR